MIQRIDLPGFMLKAALAGWCLLVPRANGDQFEAVRSPVKIGFIAPLTGPFAEWGASLKNGMEIAAQHTQHKFSVDYQDDTCESVKALAIGQRFMAVEGINLSNYSAPFGGIGPTILG